ncbi:MAG TPA: PfkB family carbohydrate kinase [Acidobacteriota bacterium]|nr:PfkB family carbohydrate kinase [Acidobacteriota bacterium]
MQIKTLKSPSDTFDLEFRQDRTFDLVGFGLNAVDHLCVVPQYPRFDSKTAILHYEKLAGGQAATTVSFVARMGMKGKYIGKVGSDDLGQFSLQSLRSEKIDTSAVLVEQGARNQYAFIIVDKGSGERTILWERDPRLSFRESELKKEDVCAGKVLHLDGHDHLAAIRAATWAQEQGIPVVIDLDKVVPQTEELISKVDFLITSSNFPPDFTTIDDPIDSLLALRQYCSGFLAVTLGARGAMAVIGNECIRFPAFKVHAVDTTGAGDIFHGGFIYGLLQNWPLERIMAFANAAAGLNCTHLGARSGIPPLAEILKLADAAESAHS